MGAALGYLEKMAECAEKAGDIQARFYALGSAFDLQAQQGNLDAMESIEGELEQAIGHAEHRFSRYASQPCLAGGMGGRFPATRTGVMEPAVSTIMDLHQRGDGPLAVFALSCAG